MLRGARAAVARKGFGADLKALADASPEDYMIATNIAKPSDSIVTAAARADVPAKVLTAFRTLLLSTSDVPGTEGRKTALRYNGHGNNILFGPASFFTTPNFADTHSPLIVQLHDGPPQNSHLDIESPCNASQLAASPIMQVEPRMPSFERMHQIVAEDPRAQAKFFILMTELH